MINEELKSEENTKNYVTVAGVGKLGIKIDITYYIDENVSFKLF